MFEDLKAHIHPKGIALRARQIWISCDTKLPKLLRSVIIILFITIGSCTYIFIRQCKYVPCSKFYSFPLLFCTYSVYIYKISRYKLTSTRRGGGPFRTAWVRSANQITRLDNKEIQNENKRPQWVLDEGGPLSKRVPRSDGQSDWAWWPQQVTWGISRAKCNGTGHSNLVSAFAFRTTWPTWNKSKTLSLPNWKFY